jgi:hypothetical protein
VEAHPGTLGVHPGALDAPYAWVGRGNPEAVKAHPPPEAVMGSPWSRGGSSWNRGGSPSSSGGSP